MDDLKNKYIKHYSIMIILNGRCDCFKSLNANYKNVIKKQLQRLNLIRYYQKIKNSDLYNDIKKEKYLKRIEKQINDFDI